MATTVNPIGSASIRVERELERVYERLRRVTVQVRSGPGGGSGVIWRPEGLIVTNAHVATEARPSVVLPDGRTFQAQVVARDRRCDLATLQVDATGLDAADVADPSSLRAGELVVALGNPMGATGALATGILHTSAGGGWVRADIRLAPGNSGGPLADAQGNIIGINSMVMDGLAVAVSSRTVQSFVAAQAGPRLGVTVEEVPASAFGVSGTGLVVVALEPNGAAHLSGLMVGDILVAAEGARFQGAGDLAKAIAAAGSAGTLCLDVIRAGALIRCSVKLASR